MQINPIIFLISIMVLGLFSCSKNENRASEKTEKSGVPNADFYLGGIQVNEENNENWVKTVKNIGMNTVEVTVYLNHSVWDEPHVFMKEEAYQVIHEIRAAKKVGLKVVLILRTSLHHYYEKNRFLWHGMIMPNGAEKLKKWFDDYKTFTIIWAEICEKEDVEILAIGSEMNALTATRPVTEIPELYQYFSDIDRQKNHEGRALKYKDILRKNNLWVRGKGDYKDLNSYLNDKIEAQKKWSDKITFEGEENRIYKINQRRQFIENQWITIIDSIRKVYSGRLTYAANFDNYRDVSFWEHLDFVGINAYFQLRHPSVGQLADSEMKGVLKENWQGIFNEIDSFKILSGISEKPVLFTELGYVRAADCTIEPWQGFGFSIVGSDIFERIILWDNHPLNPKERVHAVEALYEAVLSEKFNLAGILYWKLTTHSYHLNHEPFVLHISENPTDSLQNVLMKFLKETD